MDRESPLVTELSPDDPSFPLLSQRSPAASRGSRAAPAAAAAGPQHQSSSNGQATPDAAAMRKLPQQQQTAHSNSQQPESRAGGTQTGKQQARRGSHQKLEPLEPHDSSGKQQSGIHLPSAPAAASHAASTSTGKLPEIRQQQLHFFGPQSAKLEQQQHQVLHGDDSCVAMHWDMSGTNSCGNVFAGCSCP